ncbi:beta-defensin 119 [Rhinolophus sinicus]|uniref:beta-defensin 119 n=1 Tax=Rhinolophus sinicus TaxID=89399 RepID=UPI0009436A82|nr:PREDICTED: beta-defensin 119-like [Rhinolophus sinicus]
MKFLFLFLAIFLAMEPVVSGSGRHILRCMGNGGICRTSCKKAEHPYFYCRNYQPCCLQSYMKINISGREDEK